MNEDAKLMRQQIHMPRAKVPTDGTVIRYRQVYGPSVIDNFEDDWVVGTFVEGTWILTFLLNGTQQARIYTHEELLYRFVSHPNEYANISIATDWERIS
jgi:hypothetical protein